MIAPEDCTSLADVRAEIDSIDQQIIALIGQRAGYVKAAAKFKQSTDQVRAPERQAAMLDHRRAWAQEHGLGPDMIEQLYRLLIDYFVNQELHDWQRDQH